MLGHETLAPQVFRSTVTLHHVLAFQPVVNFVIAHRNVDKVSTCLTALVLMDSNDTLKESLKFSPKNINDIQSIHMTTELGCRLEKSESSRAYSMKPKIYISGYAYVYVNRYRYRYRYRCRCRCRYVYIYIDIDIDIDKDQDKDKYWVLPKHCDSDSG